MKSLLNIFFLFFLSIPVLLAQPLNRNTPDKILEAAKNASSNMNYYAALQQYELLYNDNKNAGLLIKMADLNFKLRDYAKASSLYASFYKGDNEKSEPAKRLDYGRALKMLGKYTEAIEQFDMLMGGLAATKAIELAKKEKEGAMKAINFTKDETVSVSNVGSNINTKNSEYSPILSSDGNLYFSSLVEPEIVEIDESNRQSFGARIMVSTKSNGNFERARTLGENINRPGYFTSNLTISPDGNEMIFARQLLSSGNVLTESKLFRSVKGENGWGPAQQLETINQDNIVKSPAFGELFGKQVLLFVSNKAGGYGC